MVNFLAALIFNNFSLVHVKVKYGTRWKNLLFDIKCVNVSGQSVTNSLRKNEAYTMHIQCIYEVKRLTCPGKSMREESLFILVSSDGVVSNLSAIFARLSLAST